MGGGRRKELPGIGQEKASRRRECPCEGKCPYDEGWTLLASMKKGHLRRSEGQSCGVGAETVGLGSEGQ